MSRFLKKKHYSSALILGDCHAPYHNKDALQWALSIAEDIKAEIIINVGDIQDQRAWSRFGKDPDFDSPALEWEKLKEGMEFIHELFPNMVIKLGNHDCRILKKAFEASLPRELIRGLEDVFNYDGWKYFQEEQLIINTDTIIVHGDETGGHPIQKATSLGMNVIQGHTHKASLTYKTVLNKLLYGAEVGCLIDVNSSAFRYAARSPFGNWIGVGVLLDNVLHLVPYPGKDNW